MDWDTATVPDPQDPATFAASKLDWSERESRGAGRCWTATATLAGLRRTLPALTDPDLRQVSVDFSEEERWLVMRRGSGTDAVVVAGQLRRRAGRGAARRRRALRRRVRDPGADQAVGSVTGPAPLAPHAGLLLRPDVG